MILCTWFIYQFINSNHLGFIHQIVFLRVMLYYLIICYLQQLFFQYMIKPIKNCPQCIYGNPCFMVCINSQCRKPGFICESGLNSKNQCALFHDKCQKMAWSELENIICENPNTKIPQFYQVQEQIESIFSNLIKKIKDEHLTFRKWVRLFGFSPQIMNFINLINQQNYNNISGVYMNQILSALFMTEQRQFESNFSIEECQKTHKQIQASIEKIKDLYQLDSKKQKMMSISTTVSLANQLPGFDSKITQEIEYIKSLFPKQGIKKVTLLYRASENNYSAAQFHKKCDNITDTITLIETEYNKVIGGYTPLAWNSSKKHWAPDKSMNSFLFSVDLKERFALNLAQFAIACNPQKGPIFGCCDICIVDNSNVQKSNAQFPISYNNFKYARNPESSQAFTGNVKGRFITRQWEVYKIDFAE